MNIKNNDFAWQERSKKLELLKKELRQDFPNAVWDGIVDLPSYTKASAKILWILKEVNDKNGGGWDLAEFLYSRENLMSYNRWKNTFSSVITVSYGILNKFPNYKEIKINLVDNIPVLRKTAVININKLPGSSRNYYKDLRAAYRQFKPFILKQIELINPNIIIGGGTIGLMYEDIGVSLSKINKECRNLYTFEKDGCIWLDAYHPAQRTISYKQYYDQIIENVKKWSINNNLFNLE